MRLKLLLVLLFIVLIGKAQNADSLVLQYLTEQNIPVHTGNKVVLLKSGEEKFDDLFSHIRQAKHHIHMEYFNFRNDSIAAVLFTLLTEKAKEGVEVRLLFDAFGNSSNNRPLKKKHLKLIRQQGIEIEKFDPIRFPYINHVFHRDHRKIVVLDGTIGYTGGMNVADYYIEGLPEIGDWRDMHLRVEGEVVTELQNIFLDIWNKTTKQAIGGLLYFPQTEEKHGDKTVAIVDRVPKRDPKTLRRVFEKSIRSAQHKVQIVNPYFVPTKSIKKEIERAIERGVDMQIMISAKSDIPFTPEATFYVSHKLMKKGATIYQYNGGFHHSKIMMIDSVFSTVGSTNLNSRSLRFDYETNAFIFDKEITKELTDLFEEDKKNCDVMSEESWKKRSKWKRFVGWFAHLFTPFI